MVSLCLVGDDCRGLDQAGNQIPPRDVWDQAFICGPCRGRLTRWIAELPSQYDDLALMLTATGRGGDGRSTQPHSLELNEPVALCRKKIRYVLCEWTRIVATERGLYPPGDWELCRPPVGHEGPANRVWASHSDPHTVAAWLTTHVDWIAHQNCALEVWLSIDDLRREAWSLANPSGRRRFPVGPCRADGCNGRLWAEIHPGDPLEFPAELACDTCDYTLPSHRWLNVLVKGRAA